MPMKVQLRLTGLLPLGESTPTLHDDSGTEVFSLNLAPGEIIELFVNLNTPSNM